MKIQVNSNNTIGVDERLIHFVEAKTERILKRFAARLTRVEVHLRDIDGKKAGKADKQCLVEARPAGDRPVSVSARSAKLAPAVGSALRKMRRRLSTFFGRKGWLAKGGSIHAGKVRKRMSSDATSGDREIASGMTSPAERRTAKKRRSPRKKRIYLARRRAWPKR